jgi:hypothetical protein
MPKTSVQLTVTGYVYSCDRCKAEAPNNSIGSLQPLAARPKDDPADRVFICETCAPDVVAFVKAGVPTP